MTQVRDADGMVASLESALKAKKLEVDRFLQNYNALHKRTAQLTDELDSQMVTNEGIELDLRSIAEQTAVSRKEAAAHAAETAKYVKLHDLAAAKIVEAEEKSVKVRRPCSFSAPVLQIVSSIPVSSGVSVFCVRAVAGPHVACCRHWSLRYSMDVCCSCCIRSSLCPIC